MPTDWLGISFSNLVESSIAIDVSIGFVPTRYRAVVLTVIHVGGLLLRNQTSSAKYAIDESSSYRLHTAYIRVRHRGAVNSTVPIGFSRELGHRRPHRNPNCLYCAS